MLRQIIMNGFQDNYNSSIINYTDYSSNIDILLGTNSTPGYLCRKDEAKEKRLATEKEKNKLFEEIEKREYKWNFEKKCLVKLQNEFKDGDILSYQHNGFKNRTIYIYMYHNRMNTSYYVALSGYSDSELMVNDKKGYALNSYNDTARFATEEEKEKLFKAIKDNGYKWNAEKKCLEKLIKPRFKVGDEIVDVSMKDIGAPAQKCVISEITDDMYIFTDGSFMFFDSQDCWELDPDKFDINTLVPFEDKVLVRDEKTDKWIPATWGLYDNSSEDYNYIVEGGNGFNMCIPYKGNEHLLGTTDDCDNYFKTWED